MSLLDSLFGGFLSDNDEEKDSPKPCANCASDCPVCPNACAECKPYKEKLSELMYDVDHLEAYYDRYEIVGTTDTNAGNVVCPHCFAPNPAYATACQYCGSQLRESSGKIRVNSGKDIPNPVMEAQNIIFDRQEVIKRYEEPEEKGGLLEALASLLGDSSEEITDTFGDRMTEDEIKSTAAAYGVSVGSYLQGLDNGKYLTLSAKKIYDKAQSKRTAADVGMGGLGLGGMAAGMGVLGGMQRQKTNPLGAQRPQSNPLNPFGTSQRPQSNPLNPFGVSQRTENVGRSQPSRPPMRDQSDRGPFSQDRRPMPPQGDRRNDDRRNDMDPFGRGRPGMNRSESPFGSGRPGSSDQSSAKPSASNKPANTVSVSNKTSKPTLTFASKPATGKSVVLKPAAPKANASFTDKLGADKSEASLSRKKPAPTQPASLKQSKNGSDKSRAGGKKPGRG